MSNRLRTILNTRAAALALAVVLAVLIGRPAGTNAQLPSEGVRLSFYGYQSAPLGLFDEAHQNELSLRLGGTVGPVFQGSSHYFGFLSQGHYTLGYDDLSDTRVDCPEFPCTSCSYRMYAWFEGPAGTLLIGGVSAGCCDQNAQLAGNEWEGYSPTDFTHMRVVVDAHEPLNICPKAFLLPITWVEEPVPVDHSTWGRLKALYR